MASEQRLNDWWTSPVELAPGWPALRLAVKGHRSAVLAEWPNRSRHARLLMVNVVDPLGGDRLAAVKLQSDEVPGMTVDPFGCQWDNKSIANGLSAAAKSSGQLVGLVPATSWCVVKNLFFHNFCPDTLQPLTTCRDEKLLDRLGLERFSGSKVRYELASIGQEPRRCYTWSRDSGGPARGGVMVRRRSELYRDYAAVFQTDWSEAQRSRLAEQFPCWTCPLRAECYATVGPDAAVLAEERLVPIVYHEAVAQLFSGMTLTWEEACRVLGGAAAADVCDREFGKCGEDGPAAECVTALAARLDGARAWFTPSAKGAMSAISASTAQQLAREVAMVKLRVFERVCAEVSAYHQSTGQPHSDLSPRSLRVTFDGLDGAVVPSRWMAMPMLWHADFAPIVTVSTASSFGVQDVDSASDSAVTRHGDSLDHAKGEVGKLAVVVPPPGDDPLQRSPLVDASVFRATAQGKLKISTERGLRMVEFVSPHTRFQRIVPGDVAQIVVTRESADLGFRQLGGTIVEVGPSSLLVDIGRDVVPAEGFAVGSAEVPAELATYQKYNSACDLWALASLLANLLIVNDGRDAVATDEILRGICARLRSRIGASPGTIEDLARGCIQQAKELDSREIFFPESLRKCLARSPISVTIWTDIWILIVKMATTIPGFSFAEGYSSSAPMDEILQAVEALALRVEVESFGLEARRAELADAVAHQMAILAQGAGKTALDGS